jgi:hypothetical protein
MEETSARKNVVAGEGEGEESECGGHRGHLRMRSGPTRVDLDHNEGLNFHNAFDIRAPHSQRLSASFNSLFGAFLPNRTPFSHQGSRSDS